MEQVIKCTNDTNKNAVRFCDDCDLPFCTECLRKDLSGLYYCQWCYPALFKDTSPEYEIPIDEKGLMKIQSEIQDEVRKIASKNENLKHESYNIFKNIIVSGIIAIVWSIFADIYYVTMLRQDSANFGFYIMWVLVIMAILSIVFGIIGKEKDLKIYIICCLFGTVPFSSDFKTPINIDLHEFKIASV